MKFSTYTFLVGFFVMALTTQSLSSTVNLVTNGDFESGNLNGWTVSRYNTASPERTGTNIQSVELFAVAAEGISSNAAVFQVGDLYSSGNTRYRGIELEQNIVITSTSQLEFIADISSDNSFASGRNGEGGFFEVFLDGTPIANFDFDVISGETIERHQLRALINPAEVGSTILSIRITRLGAIFTDATPRQLIDNIALNQSMAAVPLPATWLALLTAVVGLAAFRTRNC